MKIKLKRVYDKPSKDDGYRILVERLWPRGFKKEDLAMDAWLKDVAPSSPLRKWYSHDLSKWDEFKQKYYKELDSKTEALESIKIALQKSAVTFLFSSKDLEHNSAVCLKHYLESKK